MIEKKLISRVLLVSLFVITFLNQSGTVNKSAKFKKYWKFFTHKKRIWQKYTIKYLLYSTIDKGKSVKDETIRKINSSSYTQFITTVIHLPIQHRLYNEYLTCATMHARYWTKVCMFHFFHIWFLLWLVPQLVQGSS